MDNDPAPQYPGKRLPEVGLLVTALFWREVGRGVNLPWGTHPRPLLKDSHPWAAGVGLGAVGTCTLTAPSRFPPQLTLCLQRKPCSGQTDCSRPSAPTQLAAGVAGSPGPAFCTSAGLVLPSLGFTAIGLSIP